MFASETVGTAAVPTATWCAYLETCYVLARLSCRCLTVSWLKGFAAHAPEPRVVLCSGRARSQAWAMNCVNVGEAGAGGVEQARVVFMPLRHVVHVAWIKNRQLTTDVAPFPT